MKIVYSVLLLVLSLLIGLQQVIIVVHFKLNQDAIEQRFCINKNKPKLQCHGTCHLKKKLQETKNTESTLHSIYPGIDIAPVLITEWEIKNSITEIQSKSSINNEIFYIAPYQEVLVPPPIV